jgi:hypothetical protein
MTVTVDFLAGPSRLGIVNIGVIVMIEVPAVKKR